MAYIEVHQSLFTHRKTLKLCRLLSMDRFAVTGRLIALWQWGLDNTPEGDLGEDFPDYVGEVMGWPGDPTPLIEGLAAAGFIEQRAEDGHYLIHDWMDYVRCPVASPVRTAARREYESAARTLRPLILERDQFTCQCRGTSAPPLEIDHIIPIAFGGSSDPTNLQVLCRLCNRRKGAR